MVDSDLRTGLYVTIPVYFVIMACVAFWAYRRHEQMRKEHVKDALSAHYLGGRDFGPVITAGTMFASLFSGYTVVGVPNEAFRTGWIALRWMPTAIAILFGFIGTGLRLRKASLVRNHQSPVDFLTDRYQSQVLRFTMLFLQVIPSVIYLSAQVIAIKNTFNSMFELDPDTAYPVIIIMALILMFEWAGGLSSVALTDAIQGFIMCLSFVMLPSVIKKNFGGWSELDPTTYPQPTFYQNPTAKQQWGFWQFSLINFSFFTLPHFMQRTYAARDVRSLKVGYSVLTVGPWFSLFVGVYLGTVGVQMLAGQPTPSSPFSAILEEIMLLGGFPRVVGVIAFTASLAAIMSTADSLVIAVSQLITAEIVYPMNPNATPTRITWIGRAVSLGATVVALLIGLFWDEGISDLGAIQFGISFQAVPPFLMGLFAPSKSVDFHPWTQSMGAWVGTIVTFALYFGYVKPKDDPRPINAGVMGLACQLAATSILELIRRYVYPKSPSIKETKVDDPEEIGSFPERPSWDFPKLKRFGERPLTPAFVWKLMEGINEPMTNIWYCLLFFATVSLITPLVPESVPPLNDDGTFVYLPSVVNGIPWWAFKIILLCAPPYFVLLCAVSRLPDSMELDEDAVMKDGVDPDVVLLTPKEMGRRHSYDERNTLIYRRRSTILANMKDLGIGPSASQEEEEDLRGDSRRRRLSQLVMGDENLPDTAVDSESSVEEKIVEESVEEAVAVEDP